MTENRKPKRNTLVSRFAAALLSAAVLGAALAPAGIAAAPVSNAGPAKAASKDDKCKQIKNKKKRKQCFAHHQGAGHS